MFKLKDDVVVGILRKYVEGQRRLEILRRDLQGLVQDVRRTLKDETQQRWSSLEHETQRVEAEATSLSAEVQAVIRNGTPRNVEFGGYAIRYSNPQKESVDPVVLLQKYPHTEDLPDLFVTTVDVDAFKEAIARGDLPEKADDLVLRSPRYKAGKVEGPRPVKKK